MLTRTVLVTTELGTAVTCSAAFTVIMTLYDFPFCAPDRIVYCEVISPANDILIVPETGDSSASEAST